jgi:predicted PurR-regulated permease PerM
LDEAFQTIVSKTNVENAVNGVFENVKNAGIFLFKIVIALILSFVFIIDRTKIDEFTSGLKRGNFASIYEQFALLFEKITKSF